MKIARPPLPPFNAASAALKVRAAENGWNNKDPEAVSHAYSMESEWRNRSQFINGRAEIIDFLTAKWENELDYKLIKELWAFSGNRIAVRFAYEYRNKDNQWFRAYGNENWEFDELGLMQKRFACINDSPINEEDRLFTWEGTKRPSDFPSLSDLGL
ncbi:nuclear transport factor 2 family protein [Psychromonas arctica]|uniref:nuclear transport factor 2 family protein n=1 Tax=Psychromonas arctica TaxID=168275 RepID=UPI002FD3C72E